MVSAITGAAALKAQVDLNNDSNTLSNDTAALTTDQANQAQAYAQLHADMDTQAALAAAYDVAEQAYTSSEQAYTNDQTTSAQVQAEGDTNQAIAIAGVVFAAPPQPINSTALGSGPVNIRALSPLTVSDTTAVAAINLTAQPEGPSTTPGDDLTVNSGVTVQSTGSSVTLLAGDNVVIQSGSTIAAASTIAITANGNDDPNGATVTVAGTLIAPSASIGVDPNATGNETFNITPSATTPISVDGGSDSSGANTLNFNAEGLPVTISGDTITAGTLAPVTFTNIQVVNITNEAGSSFSVSAGGIYNGKAFSATLQVSGAASLENITPTLTYYRGNLVSPADQLTGAPINAGTYTVVATFASNTYATALALRTFSIAPATLTVTGITANNKPYDGTTAATLNTGGAVLHGVVSGDTGVTFSVARATGTFASPDAANGITVQVASITFGGTTQDGTAASVDYTLTQPTTTANITPATLTVTGITANNKPYDGSEAATLNTGGAALHGVASGDTLVTFDVSGVTGTFASPDAATGITVQVAGITFDGATQDGTAASVDYTLTQPTTTANITPATLTVTGITANNKPYDGTTAATLNTGGAVLHGVVSGDTGVTFSVAGATGTFASPDAASGITVQVAGITLGGTTQDGTAASVDYTLTQPTTTATISQAASVTTTVGAGPFTYTGSAQGGGSGTVTGAGIITGSATVSYSANSNGTGTANRTDAGTYYLTAHYAGDANHTASDGAAVALTINPLAVILTGSRIYDGTKGASTSILTVSNAISGDTVAVASGSGTLASKNAGAQSITSFGTLALGNNSNT